MGRSLLTGKFLTDSKFFTSMSVKPNKFNGTLRLQYLISALLLIAVGGILPLAYLFLSPSFNRATQKTPILMISQPPYLNTNDHWRASPNFDDRPTTTIDTIVLHATELPLYQMVEAVFLSPSYKVSSHYTIDRDGTIYCHVAESFRAWHAGESLMPDGRTRVNDFSIGIELVNSNDGREPYPNAQTSALKQLLKAIKTRHQITQVVSHAEIASPPGRKSDPRNFPWSEIKE